MGEKAKVNRGAGNYIFNLMGYGVWGQTYDINRQLQEVWPMVCMANGKRFIAISRRESYGYTYTYVGYFKDAPHIQGVNIHSRYLTKCDDNTISLEDLNKGL